jgi:cob(I)alamin adenosyltransferase
MTSIVTKTGDDGTTGLYGGQRVGKDSLRIEAYGTVDELNAVLGILLATDQLSAIIVDQLHSIQHMLFRVGGDLATPYDTKAKQERVDAKHTTELEAWITTMEIQLPPQTTFILPGGTMASAQAHHARTVCRHAERLVVALKRADHINDEVLIFLNRLSDYLFLLARKINATAGTGDTKVRY